MSARRGGSTGAKRRTLRGVRPERPSVGASPPCPPARRDAPYSSGSPGLSRSLATTARSGAAASTYISEGRG